MLIRYSSNAKGKAVRKALVYTAKEHRIKRELIDPEAIRIITHLKGHGYDGYIVGGAVRDLLIGKKPKDFDIVTSAEPARIKRLFRNSRIIGKRFRLVHIFFGDKIYEVSTFRSLADGTIGNSFGTMDEDVLRRDFTMNALYYDPVKEQVVDYVGGIKDIQARRLQPVIPLKTIFKDDPVRMLRAVKYAASTGCSIPFMVKRAIRRESALLQPVSPSRLTEELIKILNSGRAHRIVSLALEHDLYMYLQPAAASMIDGDRSFAADYAESLKRLDDLVASDEDVRLGRKIVALIEGLVSRITDWGGLPAAVYAEVYHECRKFIMPMNPPRVELEFAVRYALREGGLNIKLPRAGSSGPRERGGRPQREGEERPRGEDRHAEATEARERSGRRRRRRSRPHPSETIVQD
jgi:poly(A) polymerase